MIHQPQLLGIYSSETKFIFSIKLKLESNRNVLQLLN